MEPSYSYILGSLPLTTFVIKQETRWNGSSYSTSPVSAFWILKRHFVESMKCDKSRWKTLKLLTRLTQERTTVIRGWNGIFYSAISAASNISQCLPSLEWNPSFRRRYSVDDDSCSYQKTKAHKTDVYLLSKRISASYASTQRFRFCLQHKIVISVSVIDFKRINDFATQKDFVDNVEKDIFREKMDFL